MRSKGHEPGEVVEWAFRTGPEPEVMIESGRGPNGPTIVAALARILAELGDDQVAV